MTFSNFDANTMMIIGRMRKVFVCMSVSMREEIIALNSLFNNDNALFRRNKFCLMEVMKIRIFFIVFLDCIVVANYSLLYS